MTIRWLGSTFRRDLLVRGQRLLTTMVFCSLLLSSIISACAVVLSGITDLGREGRVLGMAPGGVTEMALTARFLGVDLVTALQLTRIFIFMPNVPWIIRVMDRLDTCGRRI